MAQGAASLAVSVKSKNKDFKQVAGSPLLRTCGRYYRARSLRCDIETEKANAGSLHRSCRRWTLRWIFPDEMLWYRNTGNRDDCSVCGGGQSGSLLIAALTIVITIIVAFIATMLIGFEDIVDEDDEDILEEEAKPAVAPLPEGREIRISSPIQGECIPLEQVKDATFSQGILGKGALSSRRREKWQPHLTEK